MPESHKPEALLPCPFCGGKSIDVDTEGYGAVRCTECDAEGPHNYDQSQAIAAWNTRPVQEAASRELREALAEVVACYDAALAEGLHDRIAELPEGEPGCLKDLLLRRVLYSHEAALAALTQEAAPAEAGSRELRGAFEAVRKVVNEAPLVPGGDWFLELGKALARLDNAIGDLKAPQPAPATGCAYRYEDGTTCGFPEHGPSSVNGHVYQAPACNGTGKARACLDNLKGV